MNLTEFDKLCVIIYLFIFMRHTQETQCVSQIIMCYVAFHCALLILNKDWSFIYKKGNDFILQIFLQYQFHSIFPWSTKNLYKTLKINIHNNLQGTIFGPWRKISFSPKSLKLSFLVINSIINECNFFLFFCVYKRFLQTCWKQDQHGEKALKILMETTLVIVRAWS